MAVAGAAAAAAHQPHQQHQPGCPSSSCSNNHPSTSSQNHNSNHHHSIHNNSHSNNNTTNTSTTNTISRRKSRSSSCGSGNSEKHQQHHQHDDDDDDEAELCTYYDDHHCNIATGHCSSGTLSNRHTPPAAGVGGNNIITVANHYCNVVDSDVEQYFINNLSRNTSVCQSQNDIASYGSFTSLNYGGGGGSGGHSSKKSPANSVCSIHHHQRRSSIVSRSSRSKCPHHRRRKHSTSCSTLQGSIKGGQPHQQQQQSHQQHTSSYHGSSSSIFEPAPPPPLPASELVGSCGYIGCTIGLNGGGGDESSVSIVLTPSKITIEHQSDVDDGDDRVDSDCDDGRPPPIPPPLDLPQYSSSSSPIKWNFSGNGDGELNKNEARIMSSSDTSTDSQKPLRYRQQQQQQSDIWQTNNGGSNAAGEPKTSHVVYHHESEVYDNCCDNYAFYQHDSMYDVSDVYDPDAVAEVDDSDAELNEFFAKSTQRPTLPNNNPPALLMNNQLDIHRSPQRAANATMSIDILNRNNISSVINQLNLSPEFRQYEKTTNLTHQQNSNNLTPNRFPNAAGMMTVYNSNYWSNDGKFINTSLRNSMGADAAATVASATTDPPPQQRSALNFTESTQQPPFELFNISAANRYDKPMGINLTTQNLFDNSMYLSSSSSSAANRRYRQSQMFTMTGSGAEASAAADGGNGNLLGQQQQTRPAPVPPPMPHPAVQPSMMPASAANRLESVTNTMGLGGLYRIVRKRAKKCADFINGDR